MYGVIDIDTHGILKISAEITVKEIPDIPKNP
jgi:hypothetical protein